MSYSALYRRLRPTVFRDVVGQDHIIRTLTNSIKGGRLSHAYLFTGTRGTGKTTTAKIFARAVNCLSPQNGDLCGECELCRLGEGDLATVVFEIDAASNNGVDSIRSLRDEVNYLPPFGRYKVYIIDEAHMMTNAAFNALLKTLEEPPAHVIFVFATTEPQKIPATILSRCQRFDFRRLTVEDMASTMAGYMAAENVRIEPSALTYIARIAGGAMRDALSILDQCLSFYFGEEITLDKVHTVLGAVDNSILFKMADALYDRDAAEALRLLEQAADEGRDFMFLCEELAAHYRDLLVVKSAGENAPGIDTEQIRELSRQAERMSSAAIAVYVNTFSSLLQKLRGANQRVMLEITFIRLCQTLYAGQPVDLLERLQIVEGRLSGQLQQSRPPDSGLTERLERLESELAKRQTVAVSAPEPVKTEPKPVPKKAAPADIKKIVSSYDALKSKASMPLAAWLKNTKPAYIDGETLYIVCESKGHYDQLEPLREQVSEVFAKGLSLPVVLVTEEDYQHKHVKVYGEKDAMDDDSYKKMLQDFGMENNE